MGVLLLQLGFFYDDMLSEDIRMIFKQPLNIAIICENLVIIFIPCLIQEEHFNCILVEDWMINGKTIDT